MAADFLHKREHMNSGDGVEPMCDTQCNFMIMTDSNFSSYQRGDAYHYYGGHFKRFPALIVAPSSDHWNVVVDLGGGQATIRHSLRFIEAG